MDVDAFRNHLSSMRDTLDRWGSHVQTQITTQLKAAGIPFQFATYRVKDVDSAIGKIARKGYSDPIAQMTDLVGVRFLVLLSPQLGQIGAEIEKVAGWDYSKDRDPDDELQLNPAQFGYQSLHYVVRPSSDLDIGGGSVPKGVPCEVQIRTLLQHAYAEIVHDNMYKSPLAPPLRAERFVASSMALIETTDHLFCETMRLLEDENRGRSELLKQLADLYASTVAGGTRCDEKMNMVVLDAFNDRITDTTAEQVAQFFRENSVLITKIQTRLKYDPFWSQPVSMLAYWLVREDPLRLFDAWPFASSHDALNLVYSDLGIAVH